MKKFMINVFDVGKKRKVGLIVKAESAEEASRIAFDWCKRASSKGVFERVSSAISDISLKNLARIIPQPNIGILA
jgi:hypothetical protein